MGTEDWYCGICYYLTCSRALSASLDASATTAQGYGFAQLSGFIVQHSTAYTSRSQSMKHMTLF